MDMGDAEVAHEIQAYGIGALAVSRTIGVAAGAAGESADPDLLAQVVRRVGVESGQYGVVGAWVLVGILDRIAPVELQLVEDLDPAATNMMVVAVGDVANTDQRDGATRKVGCLEGQAAQVDIMTESVVEVAVGTAIGPDIDDTLLAQQQQAVVERLGDVVADDTAIGLGAIADDASAGTQRYPLIADIEPAAEG
ncbi:hypothetical protein [Salinicola peritrichatus]|uniref:hypothetical protein n=1 Tax=Salinicola peritrichatus TaxID=1267424 RepID=UPI000DA1A463|nr:hypothetical protein [Salinicola peritrichatus]